MCVCPSMHSNCGHYRAKTIAYSESIWPGGAALATNLATSWSQGWMGHGNEWVTGMDELATGVNELVTGVNELVTGMNGFLMYSENQPDLTKPK
jgi:X-X-X-Leu-X-X-Gly heptad repeat protein